MAENSPEPLKAINPYVQEVQQVASRINKINSGQTVRMRLLNAKAEEKLLSGQREKQIVFKEEQFNWWLTQKQEPWKPEVI